MNKILLRAGIIGCGGIARAHVAAYQANNIQITAIADINPEAAKVMAEGLDAAIFSSAQELLESGKVDMVSICTPPVAHETDAVCALANGVHVLLEKPAAHNLDAAEKIKKAADKSNAKLMVAFRHRFIPAVVKMKEMISAGLIGKPVFMHNTFCGPAFFMKDKWFSKKAVAGGGSMLDTSSHSVDIFRFLIGEVIEQNAVYHTHFDGTDVEDAAIISLKADNGTIGALTSSWVTGRDKADILIMGQKAKLEYTYCGDMIYHKHGEEEPEKINLPEFSGGFTEQITSFVNAINGSDLEVTADDGVRCLKIINNCYKENDK